MKEIPFLCWIRSQSVFDPFAVPVGPGDDMALVRPVTDDLLVTTDQLLDGVHIVLADHGPQAAGRKAMARGLSDVAAMAAEPVAAVATLALPPGFARADAEAVYLGLRAAAEPFDCPLVGGDVGSWGGPLAITVTVFARPGLREPILRSGAKVGDAVCVTGALGGAWRTTRHLTFTPRVAEALALADAFDVHAMIDLSDGLSVDLAHLAEASGLAAELLADALPIHADAKGLEDPLAAALGDGEDYELLFTLSPDQADRLLAIQPLVVPVTRIGTIVEAAAGLTLIGADGRRQPLEPTGWEHQT